MTPRRITENDWFPDYVKRLWDWYGSNPHIQETYFSSIAGKGVVNFLKDTGKLREKVLDYGCGPGHLLGHLLAEKNIECYGVDSSEDSLSKIKMRFKNYPNFKDAMAIQNQTTPYSDNFFDVITLVETIEHLSKSAIAKVLGELKRILKPGGILLITTPFDEKLQENMVYCPFCDSVFHKWQHLESYNIETMKKLVKSNGLNVVFCHNMDFMEFQIPFYDVPFSKMSFERIFLWFKYKKLRFKDKVFPRLHPIGRAMELKIGLGSGKHLCVMATKDASPGSVPEELQ